MLPTWVRSWMFDTEGEEEDGGQIPTTSSSLHTGHLSTRNKAAPIKLKLRHAKTPAPGCRLSPLDSFLSLSPSLVLRYVDDLLLFLLFRMYRCNFSLQTSSRFLVLRVCLANIHHTSKGKVLASCAL